MEWIPIEREAPKDGQKILVCYEDGTILGTRYNPRSLSTWLAWMPQPKPYIADTPQTEMDKCYKCKWWNYSYGCSNKKGICEFEPIVDAPQTDCETCKHYNPHHEAIACERCLDGKYSRYEPQTDCAWGEPNE